MIDEQRYRALIQQLATGGITGNKTYHQYHDQFVPIDSEAAGYANGGGVGSMMVPRKNYNQGGSTSSYDSRATVEDMAKAIQSSSAANNDQKLQMLMDYDNSYRHSPSLGPKSWTNSNQTAMEKLLGITPSSKFSYNNPYQPAMIMPPMTSTGFNQNSGSFGNQGIIINGKRYMSEQEAIDDMGLQTYNQFMADGGRVKPKRGLVNEPGGYAGYYAGGGADYIGLNPANAPIEVEDLTVENNDGNFLISAADALENQDGIIGATTNIMEPGVQTIEGALINDDYPNDKIRSMVTTPNRFSNTVAPTPSTPKIYQDLIMNPEYMPNRLQNLERFADNRFEDLDFQPGYNFKDAPNEVTNLKEFFQNKDYNDNPYTGFIDNKILSRGNPEKSLVNRTKNMFSNVKDGITSVGQRFKEGAGMVFSPLTALASMTNPLNPKSSNYNPNLANQLNFVDKTFPGMIVTDPNSGLKKYAPGSPLQGQAVMSGFGTNDVIGQLEKQAARHQKTIDNFANQWGNLKETDEDAYNQKLQIHKDRLTNVNNMMNQIIENQKKQAAALALKEKQKEDRKTSNQGGGDGRYGRGSDGQKSYDFGQGFGWSATGTGPVSNRTGRGRTDWADGGIITLKI